MFWHLTPAQFSAISDRHDANNYATDYRFGVVASTIANRHRTSKEPRYKPKNFMPDYELSNGAARTGKELLHYWETQVVPAFKGPNG